jgi:hypothetical protein
MDRITITLTPARREMLEGRKAETGQSHTEIIGAALDFYFNKRLNLAEIVNQIGSDLIKEQNAAIIGSQEKIIAELKEFIIEIHAK